MHIKKLLDDDAFCCDCRLYSSGHCLNVEEHCSMYDTFSELRDSYINLRNWTMEED